MTFRTGERLAMTFYLIDIVHPASVPGNEFRVIPRRFLTRVFQRGESSGVNRISQKVRWDLSRDLFH